MSNKTQLQLNNETLGSILSNVLGLPSQESLKHGAYVWKKSEKTLTSCTISFTQTTNKVCPTLVKCSSNDIDLSNVGADFFVGRKIVVASHTLTFKSATTYNDDGTPYSYSFNPTNAILTFSDISWASATWNDLIIDDEYAFIGFVVSDSPTTYPDEGVQDGYWYEKVVEGIDLLSLLDCTQLAVDTFTYTSNVLDNQTVSHSLGVIPKFAIIIAKELKNTTTIYFHYKSSYIFNDGGSGYSVTEYLKSGNQYLDSQYTSSTATNTTIKLGGTNGSVYFKAGVEYTLITMA